MTPQPPLLVGKNVDGIFREKENPCSCGCSFFRNYQGPLGQAWVACVECGTLYDERNDEVDPDLLRES